MNQVLLQAAQKLVGGCKDAALLAKVEELRSLT